MKKTEPNKPRLPRKALSCKEEKIIVDYLREHGWTKSNTPELYGAIGKTSYRALEDAFRYLENEGLLIHKKEGHANVWRLIDKNLLTEKLSDKDLNSLLYAMELSRDAFDASTTKALKKIFKVTQDYLAGHLSIYEEIDDPQINQYYEKLKTAIKEHRYINIGFQYDSQSPYRDAKPIKMVFTDNNWYIAFASNADKVILRRLTFINHFQYSQEYAYSSRRTFQPKSIETYQTYLDRLQNAMTLYDAPSTIATLQAAQPIAKYFKKGMKPFLSSQTFVREEEDGSVTFTLEYTQPIEILPFVQKWLPDLIILSPESLRQAYRKKLEKALESHTK
jgi:predicted DNA-binding transcriptional regulator YafY